MVSETDRFWADRLVDKQVAYRAAAHQDERRAVVDGDGGEIVQQVREAEDHNFHSEEAEAFWIEVVRTGQYS